MRRFLSIVLMVSLAVWIWTPASVAVPPRAEYSPGDGANSTGDDDQPDKTAAPPSAPSAAAPREMEPTQPPPKTQPAASGAERRSVGRLWDRFVQQLIHSLNI